MDFEEDRHRITKALEILEDVIGPAIHAKGLEEEAETIVRLVKDRDDLMDITVTLLGMITALMDLVTISSGRFERVCDYYHFVVSAHREELARYN